jgi:hypothetical protein
MTAKKAPDELMYVVDVSTLESHAQKPLTKAKEKAKRALRRTFPPKGLTCVEIGGSRQTSCSASGGLDYSGIPALLREIAEMKAEELADAQAYTRDNPHNPPFNYSMSMTVELWNGTADNFTPHPDKPERLRPSGAQGLRNDTITAAGIAAVLDTYDTAEARAAKESAIARAVEPVRGVKAMKPLKLKAGPAS